MSEIHKSISSIGKYNNYIIAGNVCDSFAIGEIGSTDDFYFIGTEPFDESPLPLLSGNVLDSNGELIFSIIIVVGKQQCSVFGK